MRATGFLTPPGGARWNEKTYGPCSYPNGHGHNYVLEVTVRGRPDPETGYVLDLAELKRILERAVVGPCDHRNLNKDVAESIFARRSRMRIDSASTRPAGSWAVNPVGSEPVNQPAN